MFAFSVITKTSITLANLSLGSFFSLFGTLFILGAYENYKKNGYAIIHTPFNNKKVTNTDPNFQAILILFSVVGLFLFILGFSFLFSEIILDHHILT